jgi:hypothetical protein
MIRPFKPVLSACLPLALALGAALTAGPAAAQSMGDTLVSGGHLRNDLKQPTTATPQAPQPAALPGASSKQGQAAPASRPASEMSPNEALFDAINRGDIADARDAIGRGADLGARNILGLTPIDLSVDLSRNDITFLLLSLRGAPGSGSGAKTVAANAGAANSVKPRLAAGTHPTATTLVAARTPAAAPDPSPRRQLVVSSDPGTPAPQVGFLGFGGAQRQ